MLRTECARGWRPKDCGTCLRHRTSWPYQYHSNLQLRSAVERRVGRVVRTLSTLLFCAVGTSISTATLSVGAAVSAEPTQFEMGITWRTDLRQVVAEISRCRCQNALLLLLVVLMIHHRWASRLRNQGAAAPAPIKNFVRRSSVAYYLTNFISDPVPQVQACSSIPMVLLAYEVG